MFRSFLLIPNNNMLSATGCKLKQKRVREDGEGESVKEAEKENVRFHCGTKL